MNLKTYIKESSRTMSPQFFPDQLPIEAFHGIIGVAGEAGELLDAAKKAVFYGAEIDIKNLREEIGDIFWYLMAICRSMKFDPEELMDENIEKLKIRYPNQWSLKDATERKDKVNNS